MRFALAIAACLGLGLVTTSVSAQDQPGGSSSRMLVLNGSASATAAPSNGPRILRGSPASPRAAAQPRQDELLGQGRWQVVAGERFWVFDRNSGRLAGCRDRGTANVGEREIECTFGTFGRYRRTFGNNFTH